MVQNKPKGRTIMFIYLLRTARREYNAKRYQASKILLLSAAGIAQLRQADFVPR